MTRNLIFTLCGLALLSGVASAVELLPGVTTVLPGTTFAERPETGGLVLEDDLVPFSFAAYGGTVSGTVQNRVVRNDLGTLTFYWRVISDRNSAGVIGDLRVGQFFTDRYDSDWKSDGVGTKEPYSGLLFDDGLGDVNFNFRDRNPTTGGLAAGRESYFFFLQTDATTYARTGVYDLTNFGQSENSVQYATFAPSAVPEPASLVALGLGAAALARRRRARRA